MSLASSLPKFLSSLVHLFLDAFLLICPQAHTLSGLCCRSAASTTASRAHWVTRTCTRSSPSTTPTCSTRCPAPGTGSFASGGAQGVMRRFLTNTSPVQARSRSSTAIARAKYLRRPPPILTPLPPEQTRDKYGITVFCFFYLSFHRISNMWCLLCQAYSYPS